MQIGDVVVCLGEYVVANIDGAVVIPASHAKQIISFCEEVMATEKIVRGCLSGINPKEAYLKCTRF